MNCFYPLTKDRHASNKCLLVEQELFLITAGKEIPQKTNKQTPPKPPSPFFSVHAVVDALSENADAFQQLVCPRSIQGCKERAGGTERPGKAGDATGSRRHFTWKPQVT